ACGHRRPRVPRPLSPRRGGCGGRGWWRVARPLGPGGAMNQVNQESTRAREHLANERTLLAWVRTAIALMGLGFVVARFGLFLRQLGLARGSVASDTSLAGWIGIGLVASAVVATVLATVRFLRARDQIEAG